MRAALLLAADFIERAARSDFGDAINDEYALRWTMLRTESDPVRALDIAELNGSDVEALSPDAWLWLGAQLGPDDPELPGSLIDALFAMTDDMILRLRVVDMTLRHPALALRLARGGRTLAELPQSWVRDRLLHLTREASVDANELAEMTLILLQVANKPALRLLGALRLAAPQIVEGRLSAMTGREGPALDALLAALGLTDGD